MSQEQITRVVQTIIFILAVLKINITGISNEEISTAVYGGLFLATTIYGWVRRWKKGDITFEGIRK